MALLLVQCFECLAGFELNFVNSMLGDGERHRPQPKAELAVEQVVSRS